MVQLKGKFKQKKLRLNRKSIIRRLYYKWKNILEKKRLISRQKKLEKYNRYKKINKIKGCYKKLI